MVTISNEHVILQMMLGLNIHMLQGLSWEFETEGGHIKKTRFAKKMKIEKLRWVHLDIFLN